MDSAKQMAMKAIVGLCLGFLGKAIEMTHYVSKWNVDLFLVFIFAPKFWSVLKPPFGSICVTHLAQDGKREFLPLKHSNEK